MTTSIPSFQAFTMNDVKAQHAALDAVKTFSYNDKEYNASGWGTTRYHNSIAYTISGIDANGEKITIRTWLLK